MAIQTEYEFTLPKGYVDEEGNIHIKGIMKLATVADEILSHEDSRVQCSPTYLKIILLSKVVTKLGGLSDINTGVIEGLFLEDFSYLKEFYQKVNSNIMGTTLENTEEFTENDSDTSDGEVTIAYTPNSASSPIFVIGGENEALVKKAVEEYVGRYSRPE